MKPPTSREPLALNTDAVDLLVVYQGAVAFANSPLMV
jgi:hypothetical protein